MMLNLITQKGRETAYCFFYHSCVQYDPNKATDEELKCSETLTKSLANSHLLPSNPVIDRLDEGDTQEVWLYASHKTFGPFKSVCYMQRISSVVWNQELLAIRKALFGNAKNLML